MKVKCYPTRDQLPQVLEAARKLADDRGVDFEEVYQSGQPVAISGGKIYTGDGGEETVSVDLFIQICNI